MDEQKVKISKFLSFILRHQPQEYKLSLDKHGFADFKTVVNLLKERFPQVEEDQIRNLIEEDLQQRFQLKDDKIRARYGHSIDVEPFEVCAQVPNTLFHGTSSENAQMILKEGLGPARRKFVHLSMTTEDAIRVGRRKSDDPVLLAIDAKRAQSEWITFWREGKVFLAEAVPVQYIHVFKYK